MCKGPERGEQSGAERCCNVGSKTQELELAHVKLLPSGFTSAWDRKPLEDAEQSRLKKDEQSQEPSGGGYCNPTAVVA